MVSSNPAIARDMVRGVSSSCGVARQFRVQIRRHHEATWSHHASFVRRDAAERCVDDLLKRGFHVRLVAWQFCPVAY